MHNPGNILTELIDQGTELGSLYCEQYRTSTYCDIFAQITNRWFILISGFHNVEEHDKLKLKGQDGESLVDVV